MLKILDFIRANSDWEQRIQEKPYLIGCKRTDGYIILKYKRDADFSIEMVRECRGLILDETDDYKPVCVPFFKFANYGEPTADIIDWQTAKVQEKLDGSLIKLWHHRGRWNVSTNNTIYAHNATVHDGSITFMDLFNETWQLSYYSRLNSGNCYMFELVSPKNQVVVSYKETALYHLGTRDMSTFTELDEDIGIQKPKLYPLATIENCLEAASALSQDQEGFIVVDSQWRRIKIKSPLYVALHNMAHNGVMTQKRVLEIIIAGEVAEVLAYFPHHEPAFAEVRDRLESFIAGIEEALENIRGTHYPTRKDMAADVIKTPCPGCIFAVLDGACKTVREFVMAMPMKSLEKYLKIQ